MTASVMAGLALDERRLLRPANVAEAARAACVEDTARRRVDGTGDLAFQAHAAARLPVDSRNGREQSFCVGMMRAGKHTLGRTDLHEPAEIKHGDPVGEITDG